jgi:hypothetical protein
MQVSIIATPRLTTVIVLEPWRNAEIFTSLMNSPVEDLAFFGGFLIPFSHAPVVTVPLLIDMAELILVIQSTSSLITLDGRWRFFLSLIGCVVSLRHIRCPNFRILELL